MGKLLNILDNKAMFSQFFAKDFAGPAFQLFGPHHLAAMGIILGINIALIGWGRRIPERWRGPMRVTMAALLLIDEAVLHWWRWRIGTWTVQEMLPFHLCAVLIYVSSAALLTKNRRLYEFVYLLGVAGAMQAIITPDAGPYGFPHFRFFQVFISHGLIVTAGIWLTAVEGLRPFPHSLRRVALVGLAYMVFVGIINRLLGSNYLFIARKPETASLMDVLPPWPWYIPVLLLLAALFVGLAYLPFAVSDWRARAARQ